MLLAVPSYLSCVSKMTVNVPWSTLRPNPRDQREKAAASEFQGEEEGSPSHKDGEPEIAWDVTDFGKRMAFGGIVSGLKLRVRRSNCTCKLLYSLALLPPARDALLYSSLQVIVQRYPDVECAVLHLW